MVSHCATHENVFMIVLTLRAAPKHVLVEITAAARGRARAMNDQGIAEKLRIN